MPQHDDLVTAVASFAACTGSVVCFGAAVCEERLLQFAGRNLRQLLSQIRLRLVAVKRDVCEMVLT
jgi:hypothetical protein